ncbi:C39 family peptidase [Mesobacillus foraminis]|uniref:Uncharacterized protein YvpB n=1 Tax=Mesobacillus foraminis TaxID=279826 RepID=A0A4R2B8F7_9BACI|nr:C39 family peptidase [Mesobacillus foraminis]TCN22342.1 uncharacterized protein YvpB [Mesobacillus foraminis]
MFSLRAFFHLTFILILITGCGHQTAHNEQEKSSQGDGEQVPKQLGLQNSRETIKTRKKVLIDAPHIKQEPELARGCEVTSLAMLLNDAGIEIDKMTLANKIKKVPFERNGLKGNMNEGFVGNMHTKSKPGIGVYHGPIKNLAEAYLPSGVNDLTGKDFGEVMVQLNRQQPVWVIVTSTFDLVPEQEWETWQTTNGTMKITYKMHSVLVTGYDDKYIYVNDPLDSKNRRLPRKPFIAGWEQIGKQAITVQK